MDFKQQYNKYMLSIEEALNALLPEDASVPKPLLSAMRYSMFLHSKRLRPVIALAMADALEVDSSEIMPYACAIEMIHTYSLIHDDLPCMDDDDMRRNQPANHIVFGAGMATLAGDALLNFAYETMLGSATDARGVKAANIIASCAGITGMLAGQSVDVAEEGHGGDITKLEWIHARKTAAMFRAPVMAAGYLAELNDEKMLILDKYGYALGMAFQIADDLLDITGDPNLLGKKTNTDEKRGKLTAPGLLGQNGARERLEQWLDMADDAITSLGGNDFFYALNAQQRNRQC